MRHVDPILVLRHGADIPAGLLGEVLADAGVAVETVPLYAGAGLPDHLGFAAVVSLGGVMGAYDDGAYPFLRDEKRFLAEAVRHDVPVLGICLGSQLLADALGGKAFLADRPEIGMIEVTLTDEGAADPVVSGLRGPVLAWHQDTWDPPPDAALLAVGDDYPQAFRSGTALGIQPHPEATPAILASWIEAHDGRQFAAAEVDAAALLADAEAHGEASAKMARELFAAWLDHDVR